MVHNQRLYTSKILNKKFLDIILWSKLILWPIPKRQTPTSANREGSTPPIGDQPPHPTLVGDRFPQPHLRSIITPQWEITLPTQSNLHLRPLFSPYTKGVFRCASPGSIGFSLNKSIPVITPKMR